MTPSAPLSIPRTPTFLQSLLEPERLALLQTGHTMGWQATETLVRRGAPADSAIVLLAGLAKIHTSVEGAEVLLGLSGPGDLLGEVTAVRDSVRSATATALHKTRSSPRVNSTTKRSISPDSTPSSGAPSASTAPTAADAASSNPGSR